MNPTVRRNPRDADLVVVGRVRTSGEEKTVMEGSFLGPPGETASVPTGHERGEEQESVAWLRKQWSFDRRVRAGLAPYER
jgi:hypothetical protein